VTNLRDVEPEPLVVPLSLDGSESLTFDVSVGSGLAAYHSPMAQQAGITVRLRFRPESRSDMAAVDIMELNLIAGPEQGAGAFNSPLMRTIPISRIVAAVNRPQIRSELHARHLLPPPNLIEGAVDSRLYAWTLPPQTPARLARPKLRITIPEGRKKPDDFYRRVASAYLDQATISTRAAKDLAIANDVPVTTVHRWLKEARARGVLIVPRTAGTETQRSE
jgi:hypothetical protein